MIDPAHRSTFIIQKELYDNLNTDTSGIADDNIVCCENSLFPNPVRTTMIFKLPSKKEGFHDEEASLLAIKK